MPIDGIGSGGIARIEMRGDRGREMTAGGEADDAHARGVVMGKERVLRPWDCSISNYKLRHGMMVPTRGDVAKGGKSYFVGDLTSLDYEFSPGDPLASQG